MSLHILNASCLWRVLLQPVLCTSWVLFSSGCMFWGSTVTTRDSGLQTKEPQKVLGCTNVAYVAPQSETSTRIIEMQRRIDELVELLTAAYAQQYEVQQKEGLLQSIEKKAQWSDALALELRAVSAKLEALNAELAESRKLVTETTNRMASLHIRTNELEQALYEMKGYLTPIEETIRTLRMGTFEYYTVQPGDTCKSIAAQPYIYGDETKQTLIRQANIGQVPDLDSLTPKDVLIIPRPKGDAVHEF